MSGWNIDQVVQCSFLVLIFLEIIQLTIYFPVPRNVKPNFEVELWLLCFCSRNEVHVKYIPLTVICLLVYGEKISCLNCVWLLCSLCVIDSLL